MSFHHCSIFIHLSTCYPYQKEKRAKSANVPKNDVISEIGEHWIEKYFQTSLNVEAGVGGLYLPVSKLEHVCDLGKTMVNLRIAYDLGNVLY